MPNRALTMLVLVALAGCRSPATVSPPATPLASGPATASAGPAQPQAPAGGLPPGAEEPLAAGATPGTFRLGRRVELSFAPGPPVAVDVAVQTVLGAPVAAIRLPARDGPAAWSFDLRPGTYDVRLTPAPDAAGAPDYAPPDVETVHIDKDGRAHWPFGRDDSAAFVRRLTGLWPAGVVVPDLQPVLRWDPVPGAASYTVTVFTTAREPDRPPATTTRPEYAVDSPLERNEEYDWTVTALAADGRVLAAATAAVLSRGSKPAPAPAAPAPGTGRAGIVVSDSGVLLPGDRTAPPGGSGILPPPPKAFTHFPAARVRGLLPGSPGIDAGLLPEDKIVRVNGEPLADDVDGGQVQRLRTGWGPNMRGPGPAADFVRRVRALPPGASARLTLWRGDVEERDVVLTLPAEPPSRPAGHE